jgi:poly(3-hydroxybutyrate) depolymerase
MNSGLRSRSWKTPLSVLAGFMVVATVVGLCVTYVWSTRSTIIHGVLDVDGQRREYRLVIPRSADGRASVPVVFALHGANDTTDEMAKYTGLDDLAVEKGFLLVYLQGRILNWPPFIPAENPDILEPDLEFFAAMCDLVASRHRADPQRIYLLGVSQGGAMANAITAKCSERIAATVVGCGWMPEPLDVEPLGTRHKCPMLFMVGSQDRQVPPEAVRVGHDVFAREGHLVAFRVIEGFGHGWPRAENERVWEFFESHRLPEDVVEKVKRERLPSDRARFE